MWNLILTKSLGWLNKLSYVESDSAALGILGAVELLFQKNEQLAQISLVLFYRSFRVGTIHPETKARKLSRAGLASSPWPKSPFQGLQQGNDRFEEGIYGIFAFLCIYIYAYQII